ncbi:hypothetical protein CMV_013249, partial [Castanea mollissima]
ILLGIFAESLILEKKSWFWRTCSIYKVQHNGCN